MSLETTWPTSWHLALSMPSAKKEGGRSALLSVPRVQRKQQKKQEAWPRQTIKKVGLADWPCALASVGRGRCTRSRHSSRVAVLRHAASRSTRQSRHTLFFGGLLLNLGRAAGSRTTAGLKTQQWVIRWSDVALWRAGLVLRERVLRNGG